MALNVLFYANKVFSFVIQNETKIATCFVSVEMDESKPNQFLTKSNNTEID